MFTFDDSSFETIMGFRGNGNLACFLITKLCTIYADKFYIMADLCL